MMQKIGNDCDLTDHEVRLQHKFVNTVTSREDSLLTFFDPDDDMLGCIAGWISDCESGVLPSHSMLPL